MGHWLDSVRGRYDPGGIVIATLDESEFHLDAVAARTQRHLRWLGRFIR
ncbi:MAG: hypothetical protein ACRDZ4_12015 [Egibacteraceae bacterium]